MTNECDLGDGLKVIYETIEARGVVTVFDGANITLTKDMTISRDTYERWQAGKLTINENGYHAMVADT